MKSTQHYLNILLSLPPHLDKGETVSITTRELTKVLNCTPRNVKLILHKLLEEGFIKWQAGIGRGNSSQMTLLRDLGDVAEEYFHDQLAKDKIKEVMDLLYHKNLPLPLCNKLRDQLSARFGFQVEQTQSAIVDVLRVTMDRRPISLDPAFVSTSTEAFFLQQFCDTLVSFDPNTKTYLPALAHNWESNEDGSSWTFYLRKGVRFHHGRPFTAKDVLFTLQRLKTVHSPSRWQYEEIEHADIVSDHIITFYLKQPNRLFLHFFGSFYMSILPHDTPFSEKKMIGTGPFRMAEFTDQVLVLEAFEDFYRERALLDRVELWFIPDDIQNGQYQLPNWNDAIQEEESPSTEIESLDGCQYVAFNFRKKGVHHHPSFRLAMRIMYDRTAIIGDLKGNRMAPASSFLPDKSKYVNDGDLTLKEAQAYLRESGYSGETLTLYYWDKKEFLKDAKWLQLRCHSIGLHIELHSISVTDYYSTDADQQADLLLICEMLEDDTEWGYLRLFQDESSFLHRFFNREQHAWLGKYFRRFKQLTAPKARGEIIDKIEQRMRDENWIMFGYHLNKVSKFHSALKGASMESFGWVDFSKLWIKPYLYTKK
ncbi:ABC transporter substrate-binding protein [Paenibacillus sp. P36]|uniref:SgrR family transcriptional regulator n=1 Tax=Paenibacillus sp. P36 TaxID=3342538 RepID=UPI0038B3968A